MPVTLHHIVVDSHDLPGLARFWTQALGWTVLSERPREIVIGPDDHGRPRPSPAAGAVALPEPEADPFLDLTDASAPDPMFAGNGCRLTA
jgi:hypothetical protein